MIRTYAPLSVMVGLVSGTGYGLDATSRDSRVSVNVRGKYTSRCEGVGGCGVRFPWFDIEAFAGAFQGGALAGMQTAPAPGTWLKCPMLLLTLWTNFLKGGVRMWSSLPRRFPPTPSTCIAPYRRCAERGHASKEETPAG